MDTSSLDPDIIKFFDVSVDENMKPDKEKYLKLSKDLDDCFITFIEKSQEKHPTLFAYVVPQPHNCASGKQKFLFKKLTKLQKKYQDHYENYYTQNATKASQVKYFLTDCFEKGISIDFDIDNFKHQVDFNFSNSAEVKKIIISIARLDQYGKHLKLDLQIPFIAERLMHDAMKNFNTLIESKNDYCPISGFDDLFYCYVFHYQKYKLFVPLIEESVSLLKKTIFYAGKDALPIDGAENSNFNPWNIPKISFLGIAKIYNTLGETLKPNTPKQAMILRCSVVRFFFDQLYLECPFYDVRIDKSIYETYNNNCKIVRQLTCNELHISAHLLKEGQINMKFCDIANDYSEALENISDIQFYTDPAAIASLSSKAMQNIEKVTKKNMRMQMPASDEDDSSKESDFMAFDDIFSIFWPLLSMQTLPDPIGISLFVKAVVGLKLTSSMDYAKTVFVSAVEYIIDFNKDNV